MWDLLRLGTEPVCPPLAGGFLTTRAPGKSQTWLLWDCHRFPQSLTSAQGLGCLLAVLRLWSLGSDAHGLQSCCSSPRGHCFQPPAVWYSNYTTVPSSLSVRQDWDSPSWNSQASPKGANRFHFFPSVLRKELGVGRLPQFTTVGWRWEKGKQKHQSILPFWVWLLVSGWAWLL